MTTPHAFRYSDSQPSVEAAWQLLQQCLPTARFGRAPAGRWVEQVDSTNRLAREAALADAPEGTLFVAEEQLQGRGRGERRWQAPYGSNLLMSLILRPGASLPQAMLPFVTAVAVAEAVEAETGLRLALKWPNDLLLDGRKCGGILSEVEWSGTTPRFVVVGVGLNVNAEAEALAPIIPPATSLAVALGRPVPRVPLLATILARWEGWYQALQAGISPLAAWRERAALLGQPVVVHPLEGDPWQGIAHDVAPDGALLVQSEDGQLRPIYAADVSLRMASPPGE